MISKVRPGLGASLDRCYDPLAKGKKKGGLEVKCPLSKCGFTVDDACLDKTFCLALNDNGIPTLKHGYQYFYQVQGQLFVCEIDRVDFVVWFGPGNINICRVHFDREWWFKTALPRIYYFY